MSQTTVGLRLDENTQQRLKTLGKNRDRSPHYLMKEAVERYLNVEESIESERELTKSRWEKFELTGQSISHDQVERWVDNLANGVK